MSETGFATSDYAYDLPKELIAQDPLADRSASRLMVLDRKTGAVSHHTFSEIASFLREGDLLVLNDTKVLPVRLYGVKKDTGARVEVLLLKRVSSHATAAEPLPQTEEGKECKVPAGETVWECLVRPGQTLRRGAKVSFYTQEQKNERPLSGDGMAEGVPDSVRPLMHAVVEDELPDGNRIVRFTWDGNPDTSEAGQAGAEQKQPLTFEEILDRLGEMPLPPYITHKLEDRGRYNTIYAKYDGSAAAPTAGLHFTEDLLEEVRAKGVRIAYVTLHVGLGTFRPVKTDDVRRHHMHSEWYRVPEETARLINETKERGGRVICVGTTSCRTLESAAGATDNAEDAGERHAGLTDNAPDTGKQHTVPLGDALREGETDIFIYPGYDFKIMDGLITNFHLPESTLLMLVSAFAGREAVLKAYREAVKERYRFFSFGDAMLIL